MPARYLSNIRFVDVFASSPGRLDDHAIKFLSSGLDYLEPAFAHLVPEPGASAVGVLHEIDFGSLEQIICSEGASYEMVQRPVEKVDSQQIVSAWTLVSRPSDNTAVPSKRYLELMIEGVREYKSLDEYRRRLTEMDGFYWPVVSEVVGTTIYAMISIKAVTANQACSEKSSNG